jgi:hypothetical protein
LRTLSMIEIKSDNVAYFDVDLKTITKYNAQY